MTSTFNLSDWDDAKLLISAIAETSDKEAFKQLFQKFAPSVKAYLRRSGCVEGEAEELTQETMLTVWRKAHQFDPQRASAAAWIYTIARNRRVDALRHQSATGNPTELQVDETPSPYDCAAGNETVKRLRAALSSLPHEQAEVIRAAYVEHRAHSEISARFGLPLGTVKSRLRSALRRLRAEMETLS